MEKRVDGTDVEHRKDEERRKLKDDKVKASPATPYRKRVMRRVNEEVHPQEPVARLLFVLNIVICS